MESVKSKKSATIYQKLLKNRDFASYKLKDWKEDNCDGFKTYDGLVDLGYKKHYRHGKDEFAKKNGRIKNHINGIENFWGLAKVRLYKFCS